MNNNAIQDGKGNTSSMRVFMLAWAIMLICLTTYLTIKNSAFPNLPHGLEVITGGILFGKLFQNNQENKQENKLCSQP